MKVSNYVFKNKNSTRFNSHELKAKQSAYEHGSFRSNGNGRRSITPIYLEQKRRVASHMLQRQLVQFDDQKRAAVHPSHFGNQGEILRLFVGTIASNSLRTVPIQPSRCRRLVAQDPPVNGNDGTWFLSLCLVGIRTR